MNKTYPSNGDTGFTNNIKGEKLAKSDLLIEVYGLLDELNVSLSFANLTISDATFNKKIKSIQILLFTLAMSLDHCEEKSAALIDTEIHDLENHIITLNKTLPELTDFILPGENESSARLHLARVACRRLERNLVKLSTEITISKKVLVYINRLSDWLFVAARKPHA